MTPSHSSSRTRRNFEGVLLHYADPGTRRTYHSERSAAGDRQKIALLKGERALIRLRTIMDNADLSELALIRIDELLEYIYDALQLKRKEFGMRGDTT